MKNFFFKEIIKKKSIFFSYNKDTHLLRKYIVVIRRHT